MVECMYVCGCESKIAMLCFVVVESAQLTRDVNEFMQVKKFHSYSCSSYFIIVIHKRTM